MPATVFAIPANQHLVRRLEKHDVAAHLVLFQCGNSIEQLIEQALATKIAGDGKVPAHARIDANELCKLGNQAWGQVVDTKIAHVLKHMHGLRSARAGHSGDDNDIGDTLRALRRIHGISLLHVCLLKQARDPASGSRAINCLY